jgi:hypothetical protein
MGGVAWPKRASLANCASGTALSFLCNVDPVSGTIEPDFCCLVNSSCETFNPSAAFAGFRTALNQKCPHRSRDQSYSSIYLYSSMYDSRVHRRSELDR